MAHNRHPGLPQAAGQQPSLHHAVGPEPELLATATATFAMLADPTRLHILWLLSENECDVSELTDAVGASRTAISQHLAKLRFTGLVESRKEGRHVIYRIRDGHLRRLISEALNHADHQVTGEPTHR